ncbi:MAG: hypothetical protein WC625_06125 [Caldisericia bacterium]
MQHTTRASFLLSPRFQVLATWIWNVVGTFLVAAVVAIALPRNIALDRSALTEEPSLALIPILSEIILVGLLPIVFSILRRDKAAEYGITGKCLLVSVISSAGVVLVYFAYLSIRAGHFTTSVHLPGLHQLTVGNALFAGLGLVAYGPLEAFFVVWLIHNTDRIFKTEASTWSWGLLMTIAIYGLLHSFSQGANSLVIAAEMLALGLVFKNTRNSIGPMLAFMLMNEYAWFLATVFLP